MPKPQIAARYAGLSIAAKWEGFEKAILDPINASPMQRLEMKKAFYGGALSVTHLMSQAADLTPNTEEADDECSVLFQSLHDECLEFAISLTPTGPQQ